MVNSIVTSSYTSIFDWQFVGFIEFYSGEKSCNPSIFFRYRSIRVNKENTNIFVENPNIMYIFLLHSPLPTQLVTKVVFFAPVCRWHHWPQGCGSQRLHSARNRNHSRTTELSIPVLWWLRPSAFICKVFSPFFQNVLDLWLSPT